MAALRTAHGSYVIYNKIKYLNFRNIFLIIVEITTNDSLKSERGNRPIKPSKKNKNKRIKKTKSQKKKKCFHNCFEDKHTNRVNQCLLEVFKRIVPY